MTDHPIDLLRIDPHTGPFWPREWPENIGIVARLVDGHVDELFPFHAEEESDAPLLRAAGPHARESVGVSPDVEGWSAASGSIDDAALSLLAMTISRDPTVLELASDFAMNFDYARSEGKALLLAPVAASRAMTAGSGAEPKTAKTSALAPEQVPIDEIWVLPGATLHPVHGLPEVLALNIPGGDPTTVRNPATFVIPERNSITITLPAGAPVPKDILLNRKILDFLPETDLPARLRALRRGDVIEFTLAAPAPAAPELEPAIDLEAQAPGRKGSRTFASLLLLSAASILVVGALFIASASLFLDTNLSDVLGNGASFFYREAAEPLEALRNGLFQK